MIRRFIGALCALASLSGLPGAIAGELLTVDGQIFRWGVPGENPHEIISYAVLEGAYTVPTGASIVSPDNCGSMRPFADIVGSTPGVSHAAALGQLEAAFGRWEAAANLRFVRVADPQMADIIVGAADGARGRAFANLSYRSGHTGNSISKSLGAGELQTSAVPQSGAASPKLAQIERAYVCLSPVVPWKIGFNGNLNVYDLRHTFVHEIGHAIGLDHPGPTGSVMSYRYDEKVDALQRSDLSAVRSLYGASRPNR